MRKLLLTVMVLLVFALQFQVFAISATVSKEEAAAALANAEGVVASAYNATLTAEQAGANISSLLVRLNNAVDDLSTAEISFRQGDYNSTLSVSSLCSQVAEGVKVESDQLRLEAIGSQYMNLWFRMVVSIIAVIAVGFGSFFAWRFFKRRYYRRVLGMKPEAVSRES